MGREFLKQITGDKMNRDLFEMLLSRLNNRVSGDQLLADIANQVRLANVRRLLGTPLVTPYDVFQAYRDQNERVAAKVVEVPVEKFLAKVPEPTAGGDCRPSTKNIRTFSPTRPRDAWVQGSSPDSGRDPLDRRQCPGAGHQGQADGGGAAGRVREPQVGIPGTLRIAHDLFAGQPELTPPIIRPFDDVRTQLAVALAEEKAQAEIIDKFSQDQG